MRVSSIEICGLRGFATRSELKLALPNGQPGSGLTVLVGPNNGGKSTVVEAIRALIRRSTVSFSQGKRNESVGGKVDLSMRLEGGAHRRISTRAEGGSETDVSGDAEKLGDSVLVLPARRALAAQFGKSYYDRSQYSVSYDLRANRNQTFDLLASRLFTAQAKRDKFDALLKQVLPGLEGWLIDQSDTGSYFLEVQFSNRSHASDGSGDGIIGVFYLVDALYDLPKDHLLVIDEPELSLHPAVQRRLSELIMEHSKWSQILCATHSPYFVRLEALLGGGALARIHADDASCNISQLSSEAIEGLRSTLKNINNPHVFGLDAREVFFLEDDVILVEGQEDVVLYPSVLSQLGVSIAASFYGWGVGGAGNMEAIAKVLADLGFKKVGGLLDRGKELECDVLNGRYPRFRFVCIPADDVRTRSAEEQRPAREGLLDATLSVRPEYVEPTRKVIQELVRFFEHEPVDPPPKN